MKKIFWFEGIISSKEADNFHLVQIQVAIFCLNRGDFFSLNKLKNPPYYNYIIVRYPEFSVYDLNVNIKRIRLRIIK